MTPPASLRVLTLNLWGEHGPWQSRLSLCAEQLDRLAPDVIALQEVRDVPGSVENQAASLALPRGLHHVFAPTTAWGGGHEGLAVLSRFPVGAHELRMLPHATELEGRGVLSARLDTDLGPVWVHTTHLSYREHEGRQREDQVMVIDEIVAAHRNAATQADNPQLVLGDFNAVPDADEMRWLRGLTTLAGRRVYYQDAWDVLRPREPGYTWARANPYIGRMGWLRGDRRLDYVLVTPARRDGRGTVNAVDICLDQPRTLPGGEVVFASDHFAVMAEVQLAPREGA